MNNKTKPLRRKYSPEGTRRQYATIKVDIQTAEDLKIIAERLKVPIVEAMRQAAERMLNETKPNEVE